ncbi:flagellin [Porticoccaceae bacterium]|nr:flagellin [Porticoccaceae bacterium]MDB9999594.1 flagellin [Porticoccaceae bacterium]MDC0004268.1 flagellin [Porticoccaceae bacterium]
MATINTNVAAQISANALAKNDREMTKAMERLATGSRINSASDDAAGLAVASKLTSQIRGIDQAVRNGNDAISLISTADGAMIEVSNMLQRMRELSVQGGNGTLSSTDLTALNTEFVALRTEIERIADNTQWNGANLLDGSAGANGLMTFQVGYEADQTITVNLGDLQLEGDASYSAGATAGGVFGNDISSLTITTATLANTSLTAIDVSIAGLDAKRSVLGSTLNTLEFAVDNLANASQNASAARSRIADADYAKETTELARTQIIAQASTAMLSQANQQALSVMALLK